MESNMNPDENSDESVDVRTMKNQLAEFGLDEENLTKEEMTDLLKALNNSKNSVKEEQLLREKVVDDIKSVPSPKALKRRYVNVRDRRMPWSLMPSNLTRAEKASLLVAYLKFMAVNKYRQARKLPTFASWPLGLPIPQESCSSSSRILSQRSTRSGRTVPVYADFDDDSSDADFVVTKPKKRKTSGDNVDGVYSNKVISLKRKTSKDEISRPAKEVKVSDTFHDMYAPSTSSSVMNPVPNNDLFAMIED